MRTRRQYQAKGPEFRACRFVIGAALLASLAGLSPLAEGQQASREDVLVIALQPAAATRETVVRVASVATLSGGPASLRNLVGELDLAELKEDRVTVDSKQVSFRLQLAGIETRRFRVEGRQTLITRAAEDVTEEAIVSA